MALIYLCKSAERKLPRFKACCKWQELTWGWFRWCFHLCGASVVDMYCCARTACTTLKESISMVNFRSIKAKVMWCRSFIWCLGYNHFSNSISMTIFQRTHQNVPEKELFDNYVCQIKPIAPTFTPTVFVFWPAKHSIHVTDSHTDRILAHFQSVAWIKEMIFLTFWTMVTVRWTFTLNKLSHTLASFFLSHVFGNSNTQAFLASAYFL